MIGAISDNALIKYSSVCLWQSALTLPLLAFDIAAHNRPGWFVLALPGTVTTQQHDSEYSFHFLICRFEGRFLFFLLSIMFSTQQKPVGTEKCFTSAALLMRFSDNLCCVPCQGHMTMHLNTLCCTLSTSHLVQRGGGFAWGIWEAQIQCVVLHLSARTSGKTVG